MPLFRSIDWTRSFQQIATVRTLNIKGIPNYVIVFKLDKGIKYCTTADALMRRAYRS